MIRNSKGITIVSLIITIMLMLVITGVTVNTSLDRFEINNLNKMINDLKFLENKVLNYYSKYNMIPVVRESNNEPIKYNYISLEFKKNINDNENYYIIDLEALNDVALNYGKEGFENINASDDTYIINEETHNIYYVKGIEKDDVFYHSTMDYYVVTDKVPPTSPEIRLLSGEKNEEGKYITNIEIEIIPGKDNLSGVYKTEYSINGNEWKDLNEEDEDVVRKENNIIEIIQSDGYDIKARSIDINGNTSQESRLILGARNWEFAWICTETIDENGEVVRQWDETRYSPETLEEAKKDYVIIAKFYNEATQIKPRGFVRNPDAGDGLEALLNILKYDELKVGDEYELIIEGEGEIPPLTCDVEIDGETQTEYYAWSEELYNFLVEDKEVVPTISYVTSAKIESGITNIVGLTFAGAYSLKEIEIANTVSVIEPFSFGMCLNFKKIDIPFSVLEIYDGAFLGALFLEEINVSANNPIYSSKEGVLFDKEKKILVKYPIAKKNEAYSIPEGVETIRESGDITGIEYSLFRNAMGDLFEIPLKKLTIPSSFQDETFAQVYSNFENLEEVTVDENNQYFTSYDGIAYTKDLSKIVLYPMAKNEDIYVMPEGITNIESIKNKTIKQIVLPSTIEKAEIAELLSELDNLESITISENHPTLYSENGILYSKDGTTLVKYPNSKAYQPELIPSTVTTIGNYAFCNNNFEGELVLPNGITTIGYYSYYNCDSIETISFPDSLITIGQSAFYDCDKLESIVIPESVTTVQDSAFKRCNSLKYAKVPLSANFTSNTILGRKAFCDCELLTSIVLYGDKKTKIESREINKFIDFSNITEIIIEAPITEIDHNAFSGSEQVKNIVLPETIKGIPDDTFSRIEAFEKLQIMKTAEEIKEMYLYPWNIEGKIYDKDGNLVQ